MCIAIPVLVKSIHGHEAAAEVGGRSSLINVFLTPEVKMGDYLLLEDWHSTKIIDEAEALEIFGC